MWAELYPPHSLQPLWQQPPCYYFCKVFSHLVDWYNMFNHSDTMCVPMWHCSEAARCSGIAEGLERLPCVRKVVGSNPRVVTCSQLAGGFVPHCYPRHREVASYVAGLSLWCTAILCSHLVDTCELAGHTISSINSFLLQHLLLRGENTLSIYPCTEIVSTAAALLIATTCFLRAAGGRQYFPSLI